METKQYSIIYRLYLVPTLLGALIEWKPGIAGCSRGKISSSYFVRSIN